MSGSVWYYAHGENEKGPVTTAQMKALAAAGKIRRDDFVWKQGMKTWAPAREVNDLFSPETLSKGETAQQPPPATRQQDAYQRESGFAGPWSAFGKLTLSIGLVSVLLARGCDALAIRNVERLKAIPVASKIRHQDEWNRQRQQLEAEIEDSAGEPAGRGAGEIRQELETLSQLERTQMRQLEIGLWQRQKSIADAAHADNQIWAFWREVGFLVGSLGLTGGLLTVAFNTTGPDRWLCLGMLGAIVYSVFTGNL